MKDIAPILRSLGLLESEVKTYMSALEHGAGTVLELTKVTGLSRQATYVAIESLTERGLMSSALVGKKRQYSAEHPDKLLSYAQRREAEMHDRVTDLERSLPELELQIGGERPAVKVFEGKEGLRALMDDLQVTSSKKIDEITDTEAMYAILSLDDLAPLRKKLAKSKPVVRGIYTGVAKGKEVAADRYFLPKELWGFKTHIAIYEEKVYFVTFEGKMFSIIIESPAIAKTLRIVFEQAIKCMPLTSYRPPSNKPEQAKS
jgi:predicted DNA-binding transcriptional regulator